MQVHSSEYPQIWNMTRCLLVALCTAAVGVAGSVALLFLSLPERVDWFQYLPDAHRPWPAHSSAQHQWPGMSANHCNVAGLPTLSALLAAGSRCPPASAQAVIIPQQAIFARWLASLW